MTNITNIIKYGLILTISWHMIWSYIDYQLAYVHLTLNYSKCQGHFDFDCLVSYIIKI